MAFTKREEFIDEPLALTTAVRLSKDLKLASTNLGAVQGRFLVQQYYNAQEQRITARHQARKLLEQDNPYSLLQYVGDQFELVELQIKNSLDEWTSTDPVGIWLRSIKGIGPVIAAGLIAHLDITKAFAASSFWRFAGIDPTAKWEKGQKRPWNADLKVLVVYKMAESFVKVQNKEDDFYGHLFAIYKKKITEKNTAGGYAENARVLLATKKYDKTTETYKEMIQGRLCKVHVHAMARRKVAKLLLSHLYEVMYWNHYGRVGELPYPLVHLEGHVHDINVPNMDMFPGMADARKEKLAAIAKLPGKLISFLNTPQEVINFENGDSVDDDIAGIQE